LLKLLLAVIRLNPDDSLIKDRIEAQTWLANHTHLYYNENEN